MKILQYFFIFSMFQSVNAAIIEVPDPSGNVVVKEKDYEQSLYIDNQPVGVTDRFISITRLVPTPVGAIDVYLIQSDAGGSGTTPGYQFLTIKGAKQFDLSEDFGAGELKSLSNDGKTITIMFDNLYNRFDNSLVSPAITVIYKNGRISIKKK